MNQKNFERLVEVMEELREKCPWDKKQTIQSLRQMTIEETYELADAILDENWNDIKEELGDLMLHIVFYAKIAAEKEKFNIDDVIHTVIDKLIKRHPHVYATEETYSDLKTVKNEEDVKLNWEKIKLKEGKASVLSGVPVSLPGLVKAMRLQEKAKQVGFEWENKEDVWNKIKEEMSELQEAVENGTQEMREEELGDVLFSVVNYARFLNIDADAAIEHTNKKFKNRFIQMEVIATENGENISKLTLAQMDQMWDTIKRAEKSK